MPDIDAPGFEVLRFEQVAGPGRGGRRFLLLPLGMVHQLPGHNFPIGRQINTALIPPNLLAECQIGAHNGPTPLGIHIGLAGRPSQPPHQIGDRDRGRPGYPVQAVDQQVAVEAGLLDEIVALLEVEGDRLGFVVRQWDHFVGGYLRWGG